MKSFLLSLPFLGLTLTGLSSMSFAADHLIKVETVYYSSQLDGHMGLVESEIIHQARLVCGNNLESIHIRNIAIRIEGSEISSVDGVGKIKISPATSTQPEIKHIELTYPNIEMEATVSCP